MPRAARGKAKPAPRRVFLSYSRRDGRETAQRLSELLRGQGCEVWLDTDKIGGGASWSKEIEQGLNQCDVLIAVLTEGSYISEICRAEQIWALDEGKAVIPVLAAPGAPVPIHLKSKNWRRYPEQQAELLADIGTAAAAAAERPLRYDTVPSLPQNHILRETAVAELRDLVFTEGAGSNIAVTALAGMGGIGKTVLAAALCRDRAVQRAFPDGIAWITIGREWDGDFVTRMREVARALGDSLDGYDNKLACENRYRTILREKAALVVVDDVWNLEHLQPLLVEAQRSRFLFTTRDGVIANAVTDRRYSADLLSGGEARDLLARWAGVAVEALPPEANAIIQECGNLALAVAQVGASLRDLSPDEWRDTLGALRRADIGGIEDRLPNGQKSFFRSLAVSEEALPERMQARYRKLAVLLEDVAAPLAVLRTLWKVDEAEARRTARYFVDRSLGSWQQPGEPARGIRLHDLQLDYVRARFEDPAALELIHGALRLSANAIAARPEEFASQMVGRLASLEAMAAIAAFTKDVVEGAPRPWLRPLRACLHPPGTSLIRTLAGHSDSVNGVVVTADGRRAVSASGDTTLKVWDLESGQELRQLAGHSGWVYGVAMTGDGRRAVSASWDETLKVWDLESGQELRTLAGHTDWVYGVAVTGDGRRAVSASRDKTLKVWDLESGQELHTLVGHSDWVTGVAVTGNGLGAVSASWDKTLKVWDLESGQELRTLVGHTDWVTGVALTGDGRRAVSASRDKTLKVWDMAVGLELRTMGGHSASVTGVVVIADGRRAVSASWDGTLKVWDMESRPEVRTLACHLASARCVAVTRDGMRAVSASDDNTLKVWDLANCQELRTLAGHSNWVGGVAVTVDGRRAVSASRDKTLKVWDVESGQEVRTLAGHSASVSGVAVTGDGRRAVSASSDKTLKVWDLESGQELRTLAGHSASVTGVATIADGRRAVSASSDNTLKVWDLESGQEVRTLTGHRASVYRVAVTANGQRAVSASYDYTLKVWDLESGQEVRTLAGHSDSVYGVALTPDGRHAVSASGDSTLKVWDLASGTAVAGFTCDAPATCSAFAGPDKILAGDWGGRLYWLKLET